MNNTGRAAGPFAGPGRFPGHPGCEHRAGLQGLPRARAPFRAGPEAPATNAALREPGTRVRDRRPATGLVAASAGYRGGNVSSVATRPVARARLSLPLTIRRATMTLSVRFH